MIERLHSWIQQVDWWTDRSNCCKCSASTSAPFRITKTNPCAGWLRCGRQRSNRDSSSRRENKLRERKGKERENKPRVKGKKRERKGKEKGKKRETKEEKGKEHAPLASNLTTELEKEIFESASSHGRILLSAIDVNLCNDCAAPCRIASVPTMSTCCSVINRFPACICTGCRHIVARRPWPGQHKALVVAVSAQSTFTIFHRDVEKQGARRVESLPLERRWHVASKKPAGSWIALLSRLGATSS